MKIGPVEVNKKLFISMVVILVLAIAAVIVKHIYVNRYIKYKIDKKQDYIYTSYEFKDSKSYIPYININTDFAKDLNKQIDELASLYEDSNSSTTSISYRYNVNANIVSLVIILKNMNANDELEFNYATYVFDLDKGAKALSDEEILEQYNMTEEDVSNAMEKQMKEKYDYEIAEEILPDDCDYDTCFLKLREIENYTDGANYFIENDELVVYRSYKVYSEYNEEDIYSRDDYKFYIN